MGLSEVVVSLLALSSFSTALSYQGSTRAARRHVRRGILSAFGSFDMMTYVRQMSCRTYSVVRNQYRRRSNLDHRLWEHSRHRPYRNG